MPLTRDRLILAKAEATYGTSAAPDSTNAIQVMNDLELQPLVMELIDRDQLYGWVGNSPRIASQEMASISFSFELAGSGTAGTPPRTGVLFRGAGYSEAIVPTTSVTYAPIGENYEGMTIDCYHGGKQHLLVGVRGNITFELPTGQIPMGKFEGMGFYATPVDIARPATAYGDQADPLSVNSTNTPTASAFAFGVCMQTFTFNSGRTPVYRQLAGCTREVRIDGERAPEGEMLIESPLIADQDFFTPAATQTLGEMSWTHGTAAGNIVSFAAPTVSLGDPSYEDSDGIEMLQLPFMPIPSLDNGYDDHTFIFT